jgi:hypothetical protein
VTYQLGNLLAAVNLPIQTTLADSDSGSFALAAVIAPVLLTVIVLTALGGERHSARFGEEEPRLRTGRFDRQRDEGGRKAAPARESVRS